MTDIYQGDPKIRITENGAEIDFPGDGGQPEMDQGVENLVLISLFTRQGWPGNYYFKNIDNQIGSDYEITAEKPITLSSIEALRQSTIKALKNQALGDVDSAVTVLSQGQRRNVIKVQPPNENINEIVLQKNGLNWILQAAKGQGEL